jgi:hypothetical protein
MTSPSRTARVATKVIDSEHLADGNNEGRCSAQARYCAECGAAPGQKHLGGVACTRTERVTEPTR